jgi:hypothetical protein
MLFWITRFCLGFATLALIAFSWRASLVVAVCMVLDFFGMIMAAMPSTGFWSISRLMLGLGLALGVVTSIEDARRNFWDLPMLALVVNVLLALSWGSGLGGLGQAWIGYAISVVSLPAGCLCSAAAFDLYRREKQRRAQRRARRR